MIGYTGYVNFGHIVFYGLGGYVGLYLVTCTELEPDAGGAGAPEWSSACSRWLFGLGILRLRGAYFALATIGILVAVQAFVSNFDPWGRSTGMYLSFDAYEKLGGAQCTRSGSPITSSLAVMALSLILSLGIKISKFGLGLFAIREDEDAAVVLGVNATVYKAIIYSVSAFLPAVAGALMFYKNGMIDPSIAFEFMLSLEGIVMLMLGGQGTVIGAALGGGLVREASFVSADLAQAFQLPPGDCRRAAADGGAVCARRSDRLAVSAGAALAEGARMTPLLEVRGITKRFGGLLAVSDVSFSIAEGEILGLIGPNGAGRPRCSIIVNGVLQARQGPHHVCRARHHPPFAQQGRSSGPWRALTRS